MVYMSVPDYTSAQWAEMAGVDVAVLGDSLAMIAHGHRNTVPATMDMMVMHGHGNRMTEFDLTGHTANSFDRGVGAREDGCVARIIGQWSHGGR
jgi:hypothetical protein